MTQRKYSTTAHDVIPQADGKIEFWELELFNRAFPSLLYPAFRLQVRVGARVLAGAGGADRGCRACVLLSL
jgi:hypothetical protein